MLDTIAAAGHGGQVVISKSTRAFIEERVALKDLGEHRFKDLAAPERVYQLGDDDFPPLKSLYRSKLPIPASSFLGRQRELEELVALLTREDARLLTLIGPGGTERRGSPCRQELRPRTHSRTGSSGCRSPRFVIRASRSAVAQALDVREEPGRAFRDVLIDRLGERRR